MLAAPLLGAVLALLAFYCWDSGETDIQPIVSTPIIEQHLGKYVKLLADDFAGYRNHIYRTLSYAVYILEKRQPEALRLRPEIERALVCALLSLKVDGAARWD